MPGPYFAGQLAWSCGCYYPDVTRVRDDLVKKARILYCIVHGECEAPLDRYTTPSYDKVPMPTDDWRESERQRLREKTSKEVA